MRNKLKLINIIIETRAGRKLKFSIEEAKELYEELRNIFAQTDFSININQPEIFDFKQWTAIGEYQKPWVGTNYDKTDGIPPIVTYKADVNSAVSVETRDFSN